MNQKSYKKTPSPVFQEKLSEKNHHKKTISIFSNIAHSNWIHPEQVTKRSFETKQLDNRVKIRPQKAENKENEDNINCELAFNDTKNIFQTKMSWVNSKSSQLERGVETKNKNCVKKVNIFQQNFFHIPSKDRICSRNGKC